MGKLERQFEEVAEGRDESTPFKAILAVAVVIAVVFVLVGLIVWLVVR